MRIKDITQEDIKPIKAFKPTTPAQQRVKSLQLNIENGRKQLQAERDRQRQQRDAERLRKIQS